MGRLRVAVASLLVASVVVIALVSGHRDRHSTNAAVTAAPTSTTAPVPETTLAPPSSAPPATIADPAANIVTPANTGPARVVISPHGVVLPVLSTAAGGFRVHTPCGVATTVNGGTPVSSAAVVLDAGHGGDEPGAVGSNGLIEKTLNLAVTLKTKADLERQGFTVVLTRGGDYRMTLAARAEVVNVLKPRAFVSIHHNAEPDGPFPKPGSETYYQIASGDSKRLAGLIYEEVVKALSQYQVSWVADTDAGAKYRTGTAGDDYYAVLRLTHGTPSALGELSFISDPAEAALLARPDVQEVEAAAVSRGIVRYLTTKDAGSGYTVPYPRTEPAGGGGGQTGCVDPPL